MKILRISFPISVEFNFLWYCLNHIRILNLVRNHFFTGIERFGKN